MFIFVKMSSGWIGKEYDSVSEAARDLQEHVNNGDLVVLSEDVECFSDDMGISVSIIEIV